jgi:hypothetical protein
LLICNSTNQTTPVGTKTPAKRKNLHQYQSKLEKSDGHH